MMFRDRVRQIVPNRAKTWLRRLSARRDILPVILIYHRVADVKSDPWGLAVSPANFRDQMRMLGEQHLCISLGDLVQALAGGRLPAGKVCITFDDGYSDNLLNAKPILEECAIPATFF
ncbi:MAG: polysaccharide deacetylase family protein, partial [bacterium]